MEQWEYLTFLASGPELETRLPQLGDDGWELAGFAPAAHGASGTQRRYSWWQWIWYVDKWNATQYRVVFKRRKEEPHQAGMG
jgi:hypothetical protein